jgi:hypothetical protein
VRRRLGNVNLALELIHTILMIVARILEWDRDSSAID